MKISELKVENWRGINHFDFEPAHINVLLGPNGSGKSSVLESIKTALNGKTPVPAISFTSLQDTFSYPVSMQPGLWHL